MVWRLINIGHKFAAFGLNHSWNSKAFIYWTDVTQTSWHSFKGQPTWNVVFYILKGIWNNIQWNKKLIVTLLVIVVSNVEMITWVSLPQRWDTLICTRDSAALKYVVLQLHTWDFAVSRESKPSACYKINITDVRSEEYRLCAGNPFTTS